jgi:hypothetical protein
MASKYREHLIEHEGLTRIEGGKHLPLDLAIVGAGTKPGLIGKETVKETTASQAMQILQRLYGLGVMKMNVSFWGWQNGGYSSIGGNFPVDGWIGGNEGMRNFVDFAHSLGVPVYLKMDYAVNTTGEDGYSAVFHGARDLSGTLLTFGDYSHVSSGFAEQVLANDLARYKALGVDGLEFSETGSYLVSNYNKRYGGTRLEEAEAQQRMFRAVQEALGGVRGQRVNAYALGRLDHLAELPPDHSYHLFSSRSVPFAHIALHGLVPYTANFINNFEQYEYDLLKRLEYGYLPSFILTWEDNKLKYTEDLAFLYSTKFADWESEIVKQYQRFDRTLAQVQNQFIVGHEQLGPQVFRTTYENGIAVVVNYGDEPYDVGGKTVPARDVLVMEGGGGQ